MGNLLCSEEPVSHHHSLRSSFDTSNQTIQRKQSTLNYYPQQNLFIFDQLTFDSRFESGNLLHAEVAGPGRYNLYIAPDCAKTQYETKYSVWFYFSVSNVDLKGEPSRTIMFTIKNMNKHEYQNYLDGMLPVYSSTSTNNTWQYLPNDLKEIKCVKDCLEISFEYTFTTEDVQTPTYFAFTFPYTYSNYLKFVSELENAYSNDPDIYFHRELLTYSIEGRNIDLLTITAQDLSTSKIPNSPNFEPMIDDLFPNHTIYSDNTASSQESSSGGNKRPLVFRNKKYVFLSCRVHPCETPGSYMLEGLIKSLFNKSDATSRILLQNFVFVIIPMLNPDGVYRGHYRCDSRGRDLDRVYHKAAVNQRAYPSIHALVKVVKSLSDGRLVTFLDLHAHSAKSSGFIVGNYQEDITARAEVIFFATVYDIYSKYFDRDSCRFSEIPRSDRQGIKRIGKAGDGKSEIAKMTNLVHCYKLESGYYKGTKDPKKYMRKKGEKDDIKEEVIKRLDTKMFEELGAGIRHVVLEMFAEHPMSLIKQTIYRNVQNMRDSIYDDLLNKDKGGSKNVRSEDEGSETFIDEENCD